MWAWLALMLAPFLTGCKGFWNAPSSSGGTTPTTASSGNFYVLNVQTNEIAGFYVNAGSLSSLSGSPYALPATPFSMTVAPNNNFLYVGTYNGIYVYTIGTNGSLTLGNSGNPISSDPATSMQVDKTNSWLLDVASGLPYVNAIPISSSTGLATSATERQSVLPVTTVQQLVISPDDTYVFVAMGTGGTAAIPFAPGNTNPLGSAGNIAVKNSGGSALSVAVDPLQSGQTTPRLFYIGETAATSGSNTGGLRAFNFSTLKEISGSPYASGGLAPYSILPISTGDYVYVANRQVSGSSTGVIGGFAVTNSNSAYSLTALGSTFTAGTNPESLAEDNSGTFVFVVNFGGNPDLRGFTFDSTNPGYLDSVLTSATGTDPVQATVVSALH
jgi:6-phosphogluconolactonase (cycloisomerase 2 family)